MVSIVLADDDVDVAAFMSYSLEVAGHHVRTAFDGLGALDLVRQERPDLVVLDHSMPGLNGLEVAAALRADPGTAGLLVLMISGRDLGTEAAIVDRVVRKPLRPRQLAALMVDILRDIHGYSGRHDGA